MDGAYRGGYLNLLVEKTRGLNFSWKRDFDMPRCLLQALAPTSLTLKKGNQVLLLQTTATNIYPKPQQNLLLQLTSARHHPEEHETQSDSAHKLEKIKKRGAEGRKKKKEDFALYSSPTPGILQAGRSPSAPAGSQGNTQGAHQPLCTQEGADHDHDLLNVEDPSATFPDGFSLSPIFFRKAAVENLKARIIIFMNPIVRSR